MPYSSPIRKASAGLTLCLIAAGLLLLDPDQPELRAKSTHGSDLGGPESVLAEQDTFERALGKTRDGKIRGNQVASTIGSSLRDFPNEGLYAPNVDLVTGITRY